MNSIPVALTIAGSDPSGGAGLQADLKTFQSFGVYGMAVPTVLTDCNTHGVTDVHPVPAPFVAHQLDRVCGDVAPNAVKTGMLGASDIVHIVSRFRTRIGDAAFVLDPVITTRRGEQLVDEETVKQLITLLLPGCTLVTPSMPEAALLTGLPVTTRDEMARAGQRLLALGAGAVMLKGGHLAGDESPDLFIDTDGRLHWLAARRVPVAMHGAGDCLSAGITAALALGHTMAEAAAIAKQFVNDAINSAPTLGSGNRPAAHHQLPTRVAS